VTVAYKVEMSADGDIGQVVYPEPLEAEDLEVVPTPHDNVEVFESKRDGIRFSLGDISIVQGNRELFFSDPRLDIDSNQPFSVRIKVLDERPRISSIIASIKNPTNHRQSFDFLLRLNEDRSYYVAHISPIKVSGVSYVSVSVYDWNDFVVSRYKHQVEFVESFDKAEVFFPDKIFKYFNHIISIGFILLAIVFFWLLYWKRRAEDGEDKL
jgi:hypothetical protein